MGSLTVLNNHKQKNKQSSNMDDVTISFPNLENKATKELFAEEYKDVKDFSSGALKDSSVSVDPSERSRIELSADELKFMTSPRQSDKGPSVPFANLETSDNNSIELSSKEVDQFTEGEPSFIDEAMDATAEYFSPKKALKYLENRPYYGAERTVGIPAHGLVRGVAGFMWLGDAALTYTAGTLENVGRAAANSFGFGEGWVDYDKTWFGNNALGEANIHLKDLTRYMQKNLDINDKNVAENAAMYIPEFLVSLGPAPLIKSVVQVGKTVGQEVVGAFVGSKNILKKVGSNIKSADSVQKTIVINANRSTPTKEVSTVREQVVLQEKLAPDRIKLAQAVGGQKIAALGGAATPNASLNILKIEARINGKLSQLSEDLINNIKIGSSHRLKFERTGGTGWSKYRITIPQKDEVVTLSTKNYIGRDPVNNLPIYQDKVLIKKFPHDPVAFKKNYAQIQYTEVAMGVGVAVAATEEMLKGTGLENYKFLGGFLGAFVTPSATATAVEKIVGAVSSFAQTKKPFANIPVMGMLGKVPGTDRDMNLGFPAILMAGAVLFHKGREAAQGSTKSGEDVVRSLVDSDEFFDGAFVQRIVAASAGIPFYRALLPRKIFERKGKPESGIDIGGLDNIKPLKDTTGEIIYRVNAAGEKVPQTELSAALALRDQNVRALARFAALMEDQLDPSDLKKIKDLYLESNKLYSKLAEMKAENGFELFNFAIEQINLAIINQNMAGMMTKSISDVGYRAKLFGGSKIASAFESGAIYNMLLTQTKQVDSNLNFVKEAMTELTGTYPQLQTQFQTFFENVKQVTNGVNKQKEHLRNYATKFAGDTKTALDIDDQVLLSEIQHQAKGDGNGLGITAKFGKNEQERVVSKQNHADSFRSILIQGRDKLNKTKNDAYDEVKNNPTSETALKLQENTSSTVFIQQLEKSNKFRKINISTSSDSGMNLETIIQGWKEYGGIQSSQDFVGSIASYSKWKSLQKEEFPALEARMKMLAQEQSKGNLNVALPETKFKLGEVTKDIGYATDDVGGVDLARTLQEIDDYAADILPNNLPLAKEIYLRRLLSLLKSNDSPEIGMVNSKTLLDARIPSVMPIKDLISLQSSLSTYVHKNIATEKGVNLIPSKQSIDQILIENGVKEGKIASDLHVLLKGSYDNKIMDFLTTPHGDGKHTKSSFELFNTFLSKPSEELIPILDKMSSSFKDIRGVKQNVNKNVKEEIQNHLDDQIAFNLVENHQFVLKHFDNITQLNKAGYVSKQTYNVVKKFVNRKEETRIHKDLLKDFDKVSESFLSRVSTTIKQVEDAQKKSILGDLENVKDLGKVYDFFLANRINIASKPKIDIDSTKNFSGIEADQQEMLKIVNTLDKRKNIEDLIKAHPDIDLSSKQFKEAVEQLNPQHIREIQGTRIDTVLETVFGIKPGTAAKDVTQSQKDNLESLIKLMVTEASERSIKVTNIRQSAFGKSVEYDPKISRSGSAKAERMYKQEVNDTFFGLSSDIDIKQFGESMVELSPLFDRVFQYVGKNKIEDNLNSLFRAAIVMKAQGPDVQVAMAKLGSLNYKLTAPAALSRIYAGMRGVVSWRYLASEQLIREHQASKARILASIFTDPTFARNLSDFLEGQKITKEQSEQIRKHIVRMTGGKLVYYNEDNAGYASMLYDDEISDKQLLEGFTNGVAEYLNKKASFIRTDDSYSEPPKRDKNSTERNANVTAEDIY
tara:strand:- start:7689 stop:12818 length:5130 start_codon:yes stop_codon:yes gene_type:complete